MLPPDQCTHCTVEITSYLDSLNPFKGYKQVEDKIAEYLEAYGIEDKEEFTGEPI